MHATARAIRSRPWARSVALGAAVVVASASTAACQAPPREDAVTNITVAAASDLRPAFEEIAKDYTAETGITVTFSFGSSGQLAEQIANGAPFELFASADPRYIDRVIDAGRAPAGSGQEFAHGLLAVWSAPAVTAPSTFADVANHEYQRIVIANPDHAPYGTAAMESLEAAGIAATVEDRLIYGQSAADAFRIAASGNADLVLAPLSLAIAHGGTYLEVPRDLYAPLRQTVVVTGEGARADAAGSFSDYLSSEGARATLVAFGYLVPPSTGSAPDPGLAGGNA